MKKIKTTITVDENLWRGFSILVTKERGNRRMNEIIVELIKEWMKKRK